MIVGGSGYDVEDVDNPRTHDMVCPGCEKHVRFVEKQLVKNFKFLGVSWLGLERGPRVFQCPRCLVCVEPPTENPSSPPPDPEVVRLQSLLTRVEDEIWLWRQRAELAMRKGHSDLATEALRMADKAEREASRLRNELDRRSKGALPTPTAPVTPSATTTTVSNDPVAPTAPPANSKTDDPEIEDEIAALKRRLAQRTSGVRDTANTPPSDERNPTRTVTAVEPARGTEAPATPGTSAAAAPPAGDNDDVEALKRKLKKHKTV